MPLIEAVSEFASLAAEKRRKQDSLTGALQLLRTRRITGRGPQLSSSVTVLLQLPTADSWVLAKAADGMQFMYVPGFQLIKAGVSLMDLQPTSVEQVELELERRTG